MSYLKMLLWYFAGFVIWFLCLCMMPTTVEDSIMICFHYFFMTLGLFIGIICRDLFCKKPWLLIFLPPLHIVLLMVM